jgi:uncharacterized protein YggE
MKSKRNILIGAFAAAALLVSTFMVSKNNVVEANTGTIDVSQVRTITASGEGAIEASPDVAYVSIGVITEGKELSKVQAENTDKMTKVMASITKLGIKKEEIKTANYTVNPKYEWNEKTGTSNITGYTISNVLEVTVNDITKTGGLLDAAVASGSNSINSVRFGLKNQTDLYNQALEIAVKDAKAKAAAMGKGLSITNIQPFKITEVSNRNTPVYYQREAMAMDVAKASTPISEGQLKVSATVTVEFSFN